MWYTAHIIVCLKCKDGIQPEYSVWENIVLIKADSDSEAMEKARQHGKHAEGDSEGTLTYFDKPAELVFMGVRKLISYGNAEAPGDGTEVTYSTFILESEDDLKDLVADKSVEVLYHSNNPDN